MKYTLSLIVLCIISISCDTSISKTKNASKMSNPLFLVGTYTVSNSNINATSEGMYLCDIDDNGKISIINTIPDIVNPSYIAIHPNQKYIYAVSELVGDGPDGLIYVYKYDAANHSFTMIDKQRTEGNAPCHLHIDIDHQRLIIVNYLGTIINYGIASDGTLDSDPQIIDYEGSGPHPRQKSPHPHMIQTESGLAYVTDLGSDELKVFQISTDGLLSEKENYQAVPGSGPRHFARVTLKNKKYIYVLNEISASIEIFEEGVIPSKHIDHVNIIEVSQGISSAAIRVHPNNKFLYASIRDYSGNEDLDKNTIHAYKMNENDGTLTKLGTYKTNGKIPRDFNITPDGKFLLAGNQNSSTITTFGIDQNTGELSDIINISDVPTPVNITFLK